MAFLGKRLPKNDILPLFAFLWAKYLEMKGSEATIPLSGRIWHGLAFEQMQSVRFPE
jgi:hypothetical protein